MLKATSPKVRSALTAAVAVLVSGCGMLEKEYEPRPCPRTAIMGDAATLIAFREGPGRDLIDILHEGQFNGFKGTCQYDTEDDGTGTIAIEMRVDMKVARGPANTDRRANVPYFITITDASKTVLQKQVFQTVAEFPGNRTQAWIKDQPVSMQIPVKAGQTGRDFHVFMGFQLDRSQLDFNRKRRSNK